MLSYLKRRWKYLVARLSAGHEKNADSKVQLEQAIGEAKAQHHLLRDQAANVVANQKRTELRINEALERLERVNINARQAVVMAEEAHSSGDDAKAESYTQAAEQFANRMLAVEEEIEGMKALHFQATEAADQAKAALKQNALLLQRRLSERQALLGKLDQAKMHETVNAAMSTLDESIGEDVPTFDEVRLKIEARYAKATAVAELSESRADHRTLEIEEAARGAQARVRLDRIKTDLGLMAAPETEALTTGESTE